MMAEQTDNVHSNEKQNKIPTQSAKKFKLPIQMESKIIKTEIKNEIKIEAPEINLFGIRLELQKALKVIWTTQKRFLMKNLILKSQKWREFCSSFTSQTPY